MLQGSERRPNTDPGHESRHAELQDFQGLFRRQCPVPIPLNSWEEVVLGAFHHSNDDTQRCSRFAAAFDFPFTCAKKVMKCD